MVNKCWVRLSTAAIGVLAPSLLHAQATAAVAANSVVNSVGMNIHLGFSNTLYTKDFPLVTNALGQLHIRHVRDGVMDWGSGDSTYYQHHRELLNLGIHADLISALGQSESFLQSYPAHVADMEAIEAPNEADTSAGPSWASRLQAFLPVLRAVDGTAQYRGIPVIGPSLVNQKWYSVSNSYAALGNVSPSFDYGNLHDYLAGRNPGTPGWASQGYASISWAMQTANRAWPSKPLMATETGYRTDLPAAQAIPESIQAKYMPRLVLEQYMHGVTRSYLYELADDQDSGGSYGLLHSDGSPKAAFQTLSALMTALAESEPLTPGSASVVVDASAPGIQHLLVERYPGKYLLLLWLEVPSYDPDKRVVLPVTPASATVSLGSQLRIVSGSHIQPDGSLESVPVARQFTVDDSITMLEIDQQ